jgi:hypothetical protein
MIVPNPEQDSVPLGLSEAETMRIRAEEIYRAEVRAELSTEKDSRIWKLLNSSFVLWLLGSVTLTGTTWLLQHWIADRQQFQQSMELREKIREELIYRIFMTITSISVYEQKGKNPPTVDPDSELNKLVLDAMNGHSFIGHTDYRDTPASVLLSRLAQLPNPEGYRIHNSINAWSNAEVQLVQGFLKSAGLRPYLDTIRSNLSTAAPQ